MENPVSKYFWSDYVIRDDIPEVSEDMFTQFIQDTMENRFQGGRGGDTL